MASGESCGTCSSFSIPIQQLLTINDPSKYGINTAGSNIQFSASNGTLLYAWIQSINSSAIQVWVKNYNGSSTINMEVLPSFENLFSSNGYLGSGREYFNAYKIFPFATDFTNTTGITLSSPATIESYGLNISGSGNGGVYSTSSFGSGYFGSSFQIIGNAGGNYEYFAVNNRTYNMRVTKMLHCCLQKQDESDGILANVLLMCIEYR